MLGIVGHPTRKSWPLLGIDPHAVEDFDAREKLRKKFLRDELPHLLFRLVETPVSRLCVAFHVFPSNTVEDEGRDIQAVGILSEVGVDRLTDSFLGRSHASSLRLLGRDLRASMMVPAFRACCPLVASLWEFRDRIQGPRFAVLRIHCDCGYLSGGGAGYCPRVREVSVPATTCVFGDLSLAFGLAHRQGVPLASPPCFSRPRRKTLPGRKAH